MLLIGLLAFGLRFWQLGDLPPGLYRDEAQNGIDSLSVLAGEHTLFFESNNGREPAYIYLTAIAIALFGPTAFAVRLMAAVVGSLTTYPVYLLAKEWYGEVVALLAAFLWATTVWSIHLSRVGFRSILLVPLLALTAWLITIAWKRDASGSPAMWLWGLAGLIYALSFYTYLAARLSPLLIVILILYAWFVTRRWLIKPIISFGVGWLIGFSPWLILFAQRPDLLMGRTGQVSILNPDINGGSLWLTLFNQILKGLGMFIWEGDSIIRHNPPGRPVFDLLMVLPFLIGIIWMIRHIRQPAVFANIAWIAVMLWGTILAEDTPHFLRAVGILPVALFPAAIGLAQIGKANLVSNWIKIPFLIVLLVGTTLITVRDYYLLYGQNIETAYLFEAAARDLADDINAISLESDIYLDQTLADGWPSITFLHSPNKNVKIFDASATTVQFQYNSQPLSLFYYPYGVDRLSEPLINNLEIGDLIYARAGSWARNDLDPQPFTLYVELGVEPLSRLANRVPLAVWSVSDQQQLVLQHAEAEAVGSNLNVELVWTVQMDEEKSLEEHIAFIHVLDQMNGQLAGQVDSPPAENLIPTSVWRSGRLVSEYRQIELSRPFDPDTMQIFIGWYPAGSPSDRLSRVDCLLVRADPACDLFELTETKSKD